MKKSEGFIKLFRNYFRSVYWCKERRFSQAEALLDLIAQARFDTACVVQRMGGTDVLVGRGQLVLSLRYLARRWQWSVHCVQLFLYQLRDAGAVELETHRQFHLLTVVDLADFGGVPVVKQKVTPSSARRRKASGAAAGEAFPQLSGDTLGTPCGTKNKKEEKNKETSLARGKEAAEPTHGEGSGVRSSGEGMCPAGGSEGPLRDSGPTGARVRVGAGFPAGTADGADGPRGAERSRAVPGGVTDRSCGREQKGSSGAQESGRMVAERGGMGAECASAAGCGADRAPDVTGASEPGLDADYLDSRLVKPLAQCEADVMRQHQWLEVLAMNLHAAGFPGMSREVAARRLNEFFRKLECEGVRYKSREDAMRHFTNWLYKLRADGEERARRPGRCLRPSVVGVVLEDNSPDRFRQEDLW